MLKVLMDVMKYPFLQRAFFAGISISFCVAILGVSLVLKNFSMIGDGLSHVGFSAFSISCAMNFAPFIFSIPIVVLVAVFLMLSNEKSRIKGDAGIAVFSNSCLSIGIIVISITTGMNTNVLNYMFGNILALNNFDLILCIFFSFITVFVFVFLYNKMFSITFDEEFSRAVGINVRLYNVVIAILTALTIVVGMKMVGALLISSLIIFPVLTVSRIFTSYRKIVIFSALDSVFCFVVGFFVSYVFSIPTGSTIVVVNLFLFLATVFVSFLRKIFFLSLK